jgi:hypothetical protein
VMDSIARISMNVQAAHVMETHSAQIMLDLSYVLVIQGTLVMDLCA